jgi:KilA domain-containing protein
MSQLIRIGAVEVRQDPEGRYSLNDLHRAAGGEERHRPAFFLRRPETQELVEALKCAGQHIFPVTTLRGRNGGTYVCEDLVYDYAMWISAEFRLKVIRVFKAATGGHVAPQARAPATLTEALRLALQLSEENDRLRQQLAAPPATQARERTREPDEHPWEAPLRAWMEAHPKQTEVSGTFILTSVLDQEAAPYSAKVRLGFLMRKLGWRRGRSRIGGGRATWIYRR